MKHISYVIKTKSHKPYIAIILYIFLHAVLYRSTISTFLLIGYACIFYYLLLLYSLNISGLDWFVFFMEAVSIWRNIILIIIRVLIILTIILSSFSLPSLFKDNVLSWLSSANNDVCQGVLYFEKQNRKC